MSKKNMTLEERQRELVTSAAEASSKCFTALREAHRWASTVSVLSDAETKLLSEAKAQNPDVPLLRHIANYQWQIIPEFFAGSLPLDTMEAEAAAAREKMKVF
jgi:hypothetical protein